MKKGTEIIGRDDERPKGEHGNGLFFYYYPQEKPIHVYFTNLYGFSNGWVFYLPLDWFTCTFEPFVKEVQGINCAYFHKILRFAIYYFLDSPS